MRNEKKVCVEQKKSPYFSAWRFGGHRHGALASVSQGSWWAVYPLNQRCTATGASGVGGSVLAAAVTAVRPRSMVMVLIMALSFLLICLLFWCPLVRAGRYYSFFMIRQAQTLIFLKKIIFLWGAF